MKYLYISIIAFVMFTGQGFLFAEETAVSNSVHPFSNIGQNTLDSFTGVNIIFHTVGIASTAGFVYSGVDYRVHNYFAQNDTFETFSAPAAYLGYTFPVILGGGLFLWGYLGDESKIYTAACAVIQSMLISVVYNTLLKTITGRPGPPDYSGHQVKQDSRNFRFGFMRGGIHWGWPSGHTTVNTAALVSLAYVYHDSWVIKILSGLYVGYMFFGVIAHEGNTMHWFSDAFSGTLMGFAIGSTVGKNFSSRFQTETVSLAPMLSPWYSGVAVAFSF
ncbi:MAG: phosphatase PAP2 family protein [bacterium]|nr:phosphatase PAP2 family protein [bacterium]